MSLNAVFSKKMRFSMMLSLMPDLFQVLGAFHVFSVEENILIRISRFGLQSIFVVSRPDPGALCVRTNKGHFFKVLA